MERLNYYRNKLGYKDKEEEKSMYKNPVDKRDVFHPERERERQSIQREIMDKANERSANIQAIKDINTPKTEYQSHFKEPSNPLEPTNRYKGYSYNRDDYMNRKNRVYEPYKEFSTNLYNDLKTLQDVEKITGKKFQKEDLVPEYDDEMEKRLTEISTKLKSGDESLLYSVKEGFLQREVMNMLSRENLRLMNDLPNKVDVINKWLEENPDIMPYEQRPGLTWQKAFRGVGDQAQQQLDTISEHGIFVASSVLMGSMLGGLMSAPTLGTTAPLFTSAGALAGYKIGMSLAGYMHSKDIEAGGTYRELVDNGIPHEIAKPIAKGVGTVNGVIEVANIVPGIDNVLNADALVDKIRKEGIKASINELKKLGLSYSLDVGGEVLEELLQENVGMAGEEIAKVYVSERDPNALGGFKKYTEKIGNPEWRNIMADVFTETLASMWLFPIATGAGGAMVGQGSRTMLNTMHNAEYNKQKDHALYTVIPDIVSNLDKDLMTDPDRINQMSEMKVVLEEGRNHPEVTKKDKKQIDKIINDIDNKTSELIFKAKEVDPSIELLTSNQMEIEEQILNREIKPHNTKINQYTIDIYNSADKQGILPRIKQEINNRKSKSDIADIILPLLPKSERKLTSAMVYVNAVDAIMGEIKLQTTLNEYYNINVAKDTLQDMVTDHTNPIERNIEVTDTITLEDKNEGLTEPIESQELSQEIIEEGNAEKVTEEVKTDEEIPFTEIVEPEKADNIESPLKEYKSHEGVYDIPPSIIKFDPKRFQFRFEQGNARGAGNRLVGANYNPLLAGVILLWEDEFGDLFVVNGHHRVDKALEAGVDTVRAEILSHNDYTAEEARFMGAMINIGEDNATAIDVAKLFKDGNITEEDLKNFGIRPNSKIARDGIALSYLDDFIFHNVVGMKIPHERAVIIGNEFKNDKVGQVQFLKEIGEAERKGTRITNDMIVSIIAKVKGTAQEQFTEQTLFGENVYFRDLAVERAELETYVKGQLKNRVSVLKNVSKERNANILGQIGNVIKIDANVKEMNTAEQSLWIIDKLINSKGSKVNELFNDLAREYAKTEPMDRMSIKKKALTETLRLMEKGELYHDAETQQRKSPESLFTMATETGQGDGLDLQTYQEIASDIQSEETLKDQINLFGDDIMNQLRSETHVEIIASEEAKKTKAYKDTIDIVTAMRKNVLFNGLTVEYTGEDGGRYFTRKELDDNGYYHHEEGYKEIAGQYQAISKEQGRATFNNQADRTTVIEETIHHIQRRAEQISPEFKLLLTEWEDEVRAKAEALGIVIPGGDELFAQAYIFSELGYADDNRTMAELFAIDRDLVRMMETILGDEVLSLARGDVTPTTDRDNRLLRTEYEGFAERAIMNETFAKDLETAKEKRLETIKKQIDNKESAIYYSPNDSTYAILNTRNGAVQVSYFDNQGYISNQVFDSVEGAIKALNKNNMFYKGGEVHYQLKQYNRDTVNEIYQTRGQQLNMFDENNIKLTNSEIAKIMGDIRVGNFTAIDFDNLILKNKSITEGTKRAMINLMTEAIRNGYDVPNSEVNFTQYLHRFWGIDMDIYKANDPSAKEGTITHSKLEMRYNPETNKIDVGIGGFKKANKRYFETTNIEMGERTAETWESFDTLEQATKFYKDNVFIGTFTEPTREAISKHFLLTIESLKEAKGISKDKATNIVLDKVKADFDRFRNDIDTYRHTGLDLDFTNKPHYAISYQLKDGLLGENILPTEGKTNSQLKDVTETEAFKNWFGESKVVDDEGKPLVVYHGTPLAWAGKPPFTEFEKQYNSRNQVGYGIHFTPEQSFADYYSEGDGYTFAVYLAINNPLELDQIVEEGTSLYELALKANPNAYSMLNADTGKRNIYLRNALEAIPPREAEKNIIEAGYDGVIYEAQMKEFDYYGSKTVDSAKSYVVFNPTQIKSIYNEGTFNQYDPNINYQLKYQSPVDVEGFYSKLEQTVYDKLPAKAPGQDMYNILKKNGVKQEELDWFEIESFIGEKVVTKEDIIAKMNEKPIKFDFMDMGDSFRQYTLPGGEGYKFNAYVYKHGGQAFKNEGHFGNVENVIGHSRYTDRIGPNGEKILFIEEVQSDWHQKGRQEGYSKHLTKAEKAHLVELNSKLDNMVDDYENTYGDYWFIHITKDEETALVSLQNEINTVSGLQTLIPDAPLKDSITDFLFKSAIKDAVEGGYDIISWTTGTQQADRYNMRKFADNISWLTQEGKDKGTLLAMKGDTEVFEKEMYPNEIADYVGKQLAQELLSKPVEMDFMNIFGVQSVDGDDLSIGGEFHKKLYDNYIPRMINKYGKKWGVKANSMSIVSTPFNVNAKARAIRKAGGVEFIVNNVHEMAGKSEYDILAYFNGQDIEFIEETPEVIDTLIFGNVMYAEGKEEIGYMQEQMINIMFDLLKNEKPDEFIEQLSIPVTRQMIEDVLTNGQPLFQLKEVPETNGNLVAIHNLTEDNLRSAIKLGGFPMPSIAVTTKDYEHTRYGDISLLLNKNSIDPSLDKRNKIYGGDAWTPTFPTINKKINETVVQDINTMIRELVPSDIIKEFRLSLDYDNVTDQVNRRGSFTEAYRDDTALKYAYLKEQGYDIVPVMKEREYIYDTEVLDIILDKHPEFAKERVIDFEIGMQAMDSIINILNEYYGVEIFNENNVGFSKISQIATDVYDYNIKGKEMVVDYYGTKEHINSLIDTQAYENWLDSISSNIVEKEGIRNQKDYYTPAGYARKWEQLHEEATLSNIVRAMSREAQKGTGSMFPSFSVFMATVTNEFKNIGEVIQNSDRLTVVDLSAYEKMTEQYNQRYMEIIGEMDIPSERNKFMAMDTIGLAIIEAVSKSITKNQIKKTLDSYRGLVYDDSSIDKIIQLANEVKKIPTEYFEAKPQRAVFFNEIQGAIVPSDISEETEGLLRLQGINIIEKYDKEVEGDRQRAVREVLRQEDVSFQLKDDPNEANNAYNVNDYYEAKEFPDGYDESSWKKTVEEADITSQELKDILKSEQLWYEVRSNESSMLGAAKLLDEKGEEWVYSRLMSDLQNDSILNGAATILLMKYQEENNYDRYLKLLDMTSKKGTSAGQAIQMLSVIGRQTPTGMVKLTMNEFDKAITGKDKEKVSKKSKELRAKLIELNKDSIERIDIGDSIKSLNELSEDDILKRALGTDQGQELMNKYDPNILLNNQSEMDILDLDILQGLIKRTNLDEVTTNKIIKAVKEHYQEGKGNLKQTLLGLGLSEVEAELLSQYIRNQMLEDSQDKKMTLLSELPRQKEERKNINEQLLQDVADGNITEDRIQSYVAEKEGLPVLNNELIDYILSKGAEINQMEEGRQKDIQTALLIERIMDNVPVSFWTKLSTFQAIAQLLNFKTTIRNLIGNDMFRNLDTFTLNVLGTPIDILLSKFGNKERTMLFRPIDATRTQIEGYKKGWNIGLEDALLRIDTSNIDSKFNLQKRRVFTNKVMASLETALNVTMRATDKASFTATFEDSLVEQMLLAGVDTPTDVMVERATMLGLYRTFNDESLLAQSFKKIKKGLNTIGSKDGQFGLGELVLKYASTPANIISRAIDYSPAGIVSTMLRLYRDTSGDSYFRQRTTVEGISRAMMGTSLILTGMILAKMGIITGGKPEEEEGIYALKKQHGLRDFSVNTTAIARYLMSGFQDPTAGELRKGDLIASYDWAEPLAMSIAVGADTVLGSGEAMDLLSTAVRAANAGMTTLTEQPVLTGLSKLFGKDTIQEGLTDIAFGIPSSFTPTLFSHVAHFMDGRDTDPYTMYGEGRKAWNLVANRIPGLREQLPQRITTLGDGRQYFPDDMALPVRFFNAILNPAISSRYMPTDEAQLIFDLYNETLNTDIIPPRPQRSYTIDKESYTFTPEEYEQLSRKLGGLIKDKINVAMNSYMRTWSPEEQAEELEFLIKEAKDEIKEYILEMKK